MENSTVLERISTSPEVSLSEDQVVLLDIAGSAYYTIEGQVAVRIWQLLQTPRALSELIDTLAAEFDVDRARCREETVRYLQMLIAKRLVQETNRH